MKAIKLFFDRYNTILSDGARKGFINQILFENISRLKLFLPIFAIWLILVSSYDIYQLSVTGNSHFYKLLTTNVLMLLFLFYVKKFTQKYAIKYINEYESEDFGRFNFIVGMFFIWASVISAFQFNYNGNLFTIVVVLSSISAFIYLPTAAYLWLETVSMILLGVITFIIDPVTFSYDFVPINILGLVLFAFIISRVVFYSRKKNYVVQEKLLDLKSSLEEHIEEKEFAEEELRRVNEILEYKVEQRTSELKQKNIQLTEKVDEIAKIQEKVQASEKRYRALFESSTDGIFLIDGIVFVDCNPSACKLFGFEKNELVGQTPHAFSARMQNNGDNADEILSKFEQVKKDGHLEFEWKFIKEGNCHFDAEVNLTEFTLSNHDFTLAIIRDITERKRSQEELKNAKELAERSNRVKSEFLAQISHEIRTPVNSILSFSTLLKEELNNAISSDHHEIFNLINNGGERLIRTIDLILNMSEVQLGTYTPNKEYIDIERLVLEPLYSEFKHKAHEKNLEFHLVKNYENNISVFGDLYTITQIFTNLIDNAIKYTPKGNVTIICDIIDDKLSISVKDSGIGISEEYLGDIFQPFTQEETGYTRKFDGNGLGLALVKNYCSYNDAYIKVFSEKGKGSEFRVIFNSAVID